MPRIDGVDPIAGRDDFVRRVFDAQTKAWGAPLANHRLYARRSKIFRGVRGMWAGIDGSGLIDPGIRALINRRVAAFIGCEF
jgi:hypothetical protein